MPAFLAAVLLAASAAGAAPAHPAAAAGHRPTVVDPGWAALPSGDDMANAYPPAARLAGVAGSAKIQCKVRVDGGLEHCVVLREDPPGWGFGEATLSIAPNFRMTPKIVDGVPVEGGEVVIPINWQLDNSKESKPEDPPPTIAEAQARDPEALALARTVAEHLANFDWSTVPIINSYKAWIYPMFDRQDPARSAAFIEAFRTSLDDYAAERRDRVAASLVFQLSRDELKDLAAFLQTHSGAAFVSGYPLALAKSYGRTGELLGAFVDTWRTRYCAKVACDDHDLNGFTTLSNYYAGIHPPPTTPPPDTQQADHKER